MSFAFESVRSGHGLFAGRRATALPPALTQHDLAALARLGRPSRFGVRALFRMIARTVRLIATR